MEPYLPGLRDYVQSGGALAMVGGDLSFASGGYAQTALNDILPVELEGIPPMGDRAYTKDGFKPKLTPAARSHPATSLSLDPRGNEARWAALPPLEGINRVARLKPGASALLVHPSLRTEAGEQAPVLAVTDAGKGRTLALLTDTSWHWGFLAAGTGDDGRTFQRFWESAIRWLVRDPALTLLRVELDRVEYRRGQPAAARVRSLHADYTPAIEVPVQLALHPAEQRRSDQAAALAVGHHQQGRRGPPGPARAGGGRLPPGRSSHHRRPEHSPRSRRSSSGPRAGSWRT